MSPRHLVILTALVIGLPALVAAQDTTTGTLSVARPAVPVRAGFVDIEVVLDTSNAIRQIMSEMDAELGEQIKVIDAKKREARRLRLTLDQQDSVLSETERQSRQQQALDLLNEIDEMEYKYQRLVRDHERTTIQPLLAQVIRIVGDVGRRDGYDLIVRGEVVLYGRDTVDLTPVIIRELDNRVDELRKAVSTPPGGVKESPRPKPLPLIP